MKISCAPMSFENSSMMSIESEAWVVRGMIDHKHTERDLRTVVERFKKINMVPNGYNYPELVRHDQLSKEMQEMLMRKAQHKNFHDHL